MLVARSSPECHLYMELRPCACGEARFAPASRTESRGEDLVAVYDGACPRCGAARRFEFVLDPELPPPPPAFGGASPSRIICPGEFLRAAAAAAAVVPASTAGLSAQQRLAARLQLERAVAAMREVLKFVPAGEDRVPTSALTSSDGRRAYLAEPGRFRTLRLAAVLEAYEQGLARYAAEPT